MKPTALLTCCLVLFCTACIRVQWTRDSRFTPIPGTAEAGLVPGSSDLTQCLDALGAPLWVLEQSVEGKNGALLAWGWFEADDIGVRASYSFGRFASASFDYRQVDEGMRGLVAVFDENWVLVRLERGKLRDLTTETGIVRSTTQVLPE